MGRDRSWREDLAARDVGVAFGRDATVGTPDRFDEFLFAADYAVRGLETQYRAEGIGVPLIAVRRFRLEGFTARNGQEKFLMPRQVYPLTAVLHPVPAAAGRAVSRRPAPRPRRCGVRPRAGGAVAGRGQLFFGHPHPSRHEPGHGELRNRSPRRTISITTASLRSGRGRRADQDRHESSPASWPAIPL
jgi:hypothetical protein